MTSHELDAIRWELARRLEGMRYGCDPERPHYHLSNPPRRCEGFQPVPLTAEGLLDEERLRRALLSQGVKLHFSAEPLMRDAQENEWYVSLDGKAVKHDPDLAVAYLKAVGAWPLKEDAHD